MKIAILSGCRYTDCGAAQRPSSLARALVSLGHEVEYHNRLDRRAAWRDGVHVVDAPALGPADLCLCCLPEYAPIADRMRQGGAVVVYDLLDDWDGFVESGDLRRGELDMEADLIRISSLVTCSAPALVSRAARLGARRTELLPNAGPDYAFPFLTPAYDWVYSGYLFGSWLDWSLFEALDVTGMRGLVIGHYENLPQWRHIEAVGELPHTEALPRITSARVGIIPFRGPLCRSVDPIKYYDYLAAGLWTVTTPDVEPLAGRAWTRMAAPEWFAEAVSECVADCDCGIAPGAAEIVGDRWSDRARSLIDAARGLRPSDDAPISLPEPRPKRDRWNGIRLTDDECRLRVTWMAPASCNMEPQCPYCSNAGTRAGQPALGADPQALLAGFRWLSDTVGPLYLSVCYGEPMSDPATVEIVAELAKHNRVDLVSNLIAPLEAWEALAGRPNVAVAASYHPHHWTVPEFLRHRRRIEALGVRMGVVSVVAYPPDDTAQAADVVQDLRNRGVNAYLLPYWGTYGGMTYPRPGVDVAERQCDPRGMLCRTGMDYIAVDTAGTAYRCYMMGTPIGSILDRSVRLATSATPCPHPACPCDDMRQFWVVA